ncbi:MAG: transcriptional regulator [bacterium]|nr:transcriptional regulator [bacterium]
MPSTRRRPFAIRLPRADALSPRKEPRQARARATVEVVHEAALQVLTEVGYDRLTTTHVAERAGVSVGTLYQYYADKQSLARALVLEYLRRAEQSLRAVLEEERDLSTLVRHFVRRYLGFKLENAPRSAALRSVFVLADAQGYLNELARAMTAALEQRLLAERPRWRAGRAAEVASMCTAMVLGTTAALLDRDPAQIAEPWFGEALEVALLALLRG